MASINGNSINSSPNWSGKSNHQRIFMAYKAALPSLFGTPSLFPSRRTKILSPVNPQGQITTFVKGPGLAKAQNILREVSGLIRAPFFLGTINNPATESRSFSPNISGEDKPLSADALKFVDQFFNSYFVVEDVQATTGNKVVGVKQTAAGELDIRVDYIRADVDTFSEVFHTFLTMLQYNCFELKEAE
jgi:hypothetical protein